MNQNASFETDAYQIEKIAINGAAERLCQSGSHAAGRKIGYQCFFHLYCLL